MTPRTSLRPILRSARLQFSQSQPQRCFTSSIRKADSPLQPSNHERTTHFGFETVAEAEKEAKGAIVPRISECFANLEYLMCSCRSLQQRSSLVRQNERLHVLRNPSIMEVRISTPTTLANTSQPHLQITNAPPETILSVQLILAQTPPPKPPPPLGKCST
jgi:hypothetical protein